METNDKTMGRPKLIEVEVVRRLSVEDNTDNGVSGVRMCNPGEVIKMKVETARKMQEVGAIKIVI